MKKKSFDFIYVRIIQINLDFFYFNLTKRGTQHPWVRGTQINSNERSHPF